MMSIKKGNRFSATYSSQTYEVVGKWNGNLVLAATGPDNEECLMYLPEEIEEMVSANRWARVAEK
jgi:hypothetical protein